MAKEKHFATLQLVAMPCGLLQIVIGHVKDGRAAGYIRHKLPSVIRLQKSYAVHSCSAKCSKEKRQDADRRPHPALLLLALLAESAISDRREQASRGGDLATEAAADRIVGEKVLRVLLACAAGDVEVCVKQQRITGRDGIGYHAE